MQKLIKRSNLAEQICDILRNDISNGIYKDGEKLPTEMELTEIYGVSRLTIRAAIQRLNALGLVETRAGEGTFVKEFNTVQFLKDISSLITNPQMLNDVSEFRRLIDIECIRLAIKNATDEEIETLKPICLEFAKKANDLNVFDNNTLHELADVDYRIHLKICELSKNSIYPLTYMAVQDAIKNFLYIIIKSRYTRTEQEFFLTTVTGHEDLYIAIKERDFNKAKRIILNHVDYTVLPLPINQL